MILMLKTVNYMEKVKEKKKLTEIFLKLVEGERDE